jgi:hypothetical protein
VVVDLLVEEEVLPAEEEALPAEEEVLPVEEEALPAEALLAGGYQRASQTVVED